MLIKKRSSSVLKLCLWRVCCCLCFLPIITVESCFGILSGSFSFGRFCVYVSVVGKNNIKTALSTVSMRWGRESNGRIWWISPQFFTQIIVDLIWWFLVDLERQPDTIMRFNNETLHPMSLCQPFCPPIFWVKFQSPLMLNRHSLANGPI